jgi:predicted branched-subunit amino acid permease
MAPSQPSAQKPARRAAWRAGIRAMNSANSGAVAWGVIAGLTMMNSGLSLTQSLVMAVVVYSGTAQMVAMPLIVAGASHLVVFIAVFLAGVRFIIYSAAMSNNLRRLKPWQAMASSYQTIDGAAAVFLQRRADRKDRFVHRVSFLNGMNMAVWSFWMGGLAIGIFGAAWLPASPKFGYLGILAMFAMVVPMLKGRPAWACAVAAGLVSLMASPLPYRLGLLVAILAGIAAGVWASGGVKGERINP